MHPYPNCVPAPLSANSPHACPHDPLAHAAPPPAARLRGRGAAGRPHPMPRCARAPLPPVRPPRGTGVAQLRAVRRAHSQWLHACMLPSTPCDPGRPPARAPRGAPAAHAPPAPAPPAPKWLCDGAREGAGSFLRGSVRMGWVLMRRRRIPGRAALCALPVPCHSRHKRMPSTDQQRGPTRLPNTLTAALCYSATHLFDSQTGSQATGVLWDGPGWRGWRRRGARRRQAGARAPRPGRRRRKEHARRRAHMWACQRVTSQRRPPKRQKNALPRSAK
jgi:hypothetical protein